MVYSDADITDLENFILSVDATCIIQFSDYCNNENHAFKDSKYEIGTSSIVSLRVISVYILTF